MFLAKPSERTELCFGKHTQLHKFIKSFQRLHCLQPKGEKKKKKSRGVKGKEGSWAHLPMVAANWQLGQHLPACTAHLPSLCGPPSWHPHASHTPWLAFSKKHLDMHATRGTWSKELNVHFLSVKSHCSELLWPESPPGLLPTLHEILAIHRDKCMQA